MNFIQIIYLLSITFAFIKGLTHYNSLEGASKFIVILLGFTLINETISFVLFVQKKNNMPVYQIYSLVYYSLIVKYFCSSIDIMKEYFKLKLTLAVGIFAYIINLMYLQPITILNSHFLLFTAILIISLSLISYFRMLVSKEGIRLTGSRVFWINTILLVYWSITFLHWGMYNVLDVLLGSNLWVMHLFLNLMNIGTYTGLGLVLGSNRLDSHG